MAGFVLFALRTAVKFYRDQLQWVCKLNCVFGILARQLWGLVLPFASDRGTYTYGGNGAGPHAVTSIDDGSSYGYDADGEMTNDNGKTLTWSAFGKATQISQGATSVTLAYGPDNERYEKDVSAYGQSETVTYLGAAERLTLNGQTSIRRTLALADLTVIDTGGNNAGVLYPVTDQLGSTIDLGDGNGASADAMSYGPFGRRRESEGLVLPFAIYTYDDVGNLKSRGS
ncbi:MAG: hypothetical protein ACRD22_12395, partial [Terriglobia bacterium]